MIAKHDITRKNVHTPGDRALCPLHPSECWLHPLSPPIPAAVSSSDLMKRNERGWKQLEVLSCVFTVSVWSRGLQSLMETRYQDDGDSNASQERERPWPQVGDPFLSPLSSHVIVTCWILQGAPLGLVSSSHLLLMAGAASRAACATAGYPSPLSLPGLAAVLDWTGTLLTAHLSHY